MLEGTLKYETNRLWADEGADGVARERYRALVELIPDAVFVHYQNAVVYANPAMLRLIGADHPQELLGRSPLDFIHPSSLPQVLERIAQLSATGEQPQNAEERWMRLDGTMATVEASAVLVPWHAGRGFLVVLRDVTESRRTAEELLSARQELSRALRGGRMGYWNFDLRTGRVDWSPELEELFGMEPGEFAGTREAFFERVHPEDLGGIRTAIHAAIERREDYRIEFRFVRVDGSVGWMEGRGRARYDDQGRAIRVDGLGIDVTARKDAEERLLEANAELERRVGERTADLETANRELEGFTYTVSHDLRAPLRSILATSRFLMEDFGEGLPPEARCLLERQVQSAGKLATLVDELLRLSRLAKEPIERRPFDLSALAHEVASETLASWPAVEVEVQPGMVGEGDPRLIRLVLQNLIGNAAKFSPDGGKVRVRMEHRGDERVFSVNDDGVGFDPAQSSKLFEPFERLVSENEFPGTGVGLANVKRVVERHGGRVWADSQPGEGATFYFTLDEARRQP